MKLLYQIFDVFIREFSGYAVGLNCKPGNSDRQRELLLRLVKAPAANPEQFEKVWQEQAYALNGQYQLAD